MTAAHTARTIARDLARLRPDWNHLDRYFENQSELEHALRRLARKLETGQ